MYVLGERPLRDKKSASAVCERLRFPHGPQGSPVRSGSCPVDCLTVQRVTA